MPIHLTLFLNIIRKIAGRLGFLPQHIKILVSYNLTDKFKIGNIVTI